MQLHVLMIPMMIAVVSVVGVDGDLGVCAGHLNVTAEPSESCEGSAEVQDCWQVAVVDVEGTDPVACSAAGFARFPDVRG